VIGFLDLAAMERVRRLLRDSFAIALVAMAAVLALGVLQGLILAVVVSVGELLIRSSRPSRSVLGRLPGSTTFVARENAPEARTVPGMLVYRLNAPLLFVNAKRLRDGIRAELRDADQRVPKVVLLDLSFAPALDITSVNVLASLHHELEGQGVALWLGGVHAEIQDMLVRSGLADDIGRAHLYRNLEDAVGDASA
jgi:MFS superfamily sulfate permease-like transporter